MNVIDGSAASRESKLAEIGGEDEYGKNGDWTQEGIGRAEHKFCLQEEDKHTLAIVIAYSP